MKILNLKIISSENEVIRDILFNEQGISFILGDILKPKDLKKTSNSLGKSLLLKFIDYIFGSNNDSKVVPEVIQNYVLEAKVKFKNKEYKVVRKLKSKEKIDIDDQQYSLEEYKDFFEIDRNLFHKQIILNQRNGLISFNSSPQEEDMKNFLKLINLERLIQKTEKIYDNQNKIKSLKNTKKQMLSFLNKNEKEDKIDEQIFILGKDIKKLEEESLEIYEKIKKIKTSNLKDSIIEEYEKVNSSFKELKDQLFLKKLERQRMEKFLIEYKDVDVPLKSILQLYKKAKVEIPQLVIREIKEVEDFHKNVYSDRINILEKKIEEIKKFENNENKKLESSKEKLDNLGEIISENEIYKENIEIYEKYSKELKEKKYKQGQFSQVEDVIKKIQNEDSELVLNFTDLQQMFLEKSSIDKIEKIRDFVYDFTQSIYNSEKETTGSYFKIEVKKKHQINRPIKLDIKIDYDSGEGVSQVKRAMIDILILNFNKLLNFFIQDSSCYSGIDPRQVSSMLMEIDKIAMARNKQAIVSINRYQIYEKEDILKLIKEKESIKLSEDDKLLGIDFK